ncbi:MULTISPECIES: DeoR/GlpR family DNA-binding transcription regulator [Cellulophaga]|uniref:DeoR faimly transcriptional regulator n=1 Tax=Cellulophaga baltica 18 TaxID=1348584 RepID=A0AAU8REU7_9FLAO|nr:MULTISPECIES: DeoR/GlpR family DNA-binding transcription regulator [Cellulophaga]AIZ42020.1 DeoR faimly transcriptional regulator [Cellulophaga baltica 18]MCR1024818.1 DeoR/GlpR family DNA-binding transcription regulator [Cellulophaga baltica]QXP52154.1 DeoR/GlpR transcriptional regulator [Cellulophaga sp. HaHa_2_1]
MKKKERQKQIVHKVMLHRKVTSLGLSEDLDVSEDTIRRDLNELDTKGMLTKVHGGAVSTIQRLYHYNEDAVFNKDKKKSIALKAVPLLEDGMVIIMSGGTTNLMFARVIPKHLKATIYTYSIQIAMQLTEHPNIEIILIGGRIQKKSMVTLGIDVYKVLANIHADICFVGASGITLNQGITDEDYEIAQIKQQMTHSSDKVVSLITSNKLNVRHNYSVCPINEINVIITDLENNNVDVTDYLKAGVQIF